LLGNLVQLPLLICAVGGAEAALRVPVDFNGGAGVDCEVEGVEGVVYTGGVEGWGGFGVGVGVGGWGGRGIKLGEVKRAFGFLGCGFGVGVLGGRGLASLFFSEQGFAFGPFAGGFRFLVGFGLSGGTEKV
jgi:hypothetical protein